MSAAGWHSWKGGQEVWQVASIQLLMLFLQHLLLMTPTHYCRYIMSYIFWLFDWLFNYLKCILCEWNLFFIFSNYGPFVRFTAHHTKIYHSIYHLFYYLYTIYLFICIFKMEFMKVKKNSVAVWEEKS